MREKKRRHRFLEQTDTRRKIVKEYRKKDNRRIVMIRLFCKKRNKKGFTLIELS